MLAIFILNKKKMYTALGILFSNGTSTDEVTQVRLSVIVPIIEWKHFPDWTDKS